MSLSDPNLKPKLSLRDFTSFKTIKKVLKVQVRQKPEGCDGALVPGDPLAGASVECLPQCPWGLFVTASAP
jgi:hypothetical protein